MRPTTEMATTVSDDTLMDLSAEVRRVADCPYTPNLQVCTEVGHAFDPYP